MAGLYAATLALSAFLLFLMQPVFAKMMLPHVGGAAGVWNTCVVFFQLALLAGYAYAHAITRRLSARMQAVVHLSVMLLPLVVLPFAVPGGWRPTTSTNPVWSLFLLLTATVGLPFLVVSTTAPLLQRWFSYSSHRRASDPYFLYVASNVGSMCALAAYPTLVEPNVRLSVQSSVWSVGYVALCGLTAVCAWAALKNAGEATGNRPTDPDVTEMGSGEPTSRWQRLRWLALAAVPSSLMLSVTTAISVDIASVPLLWIGPLALYLLSFVITFSGRRFFTQDRLAILLPLALLLPVFCLATAWHSLGAIPIHLAGLFAVAISCHGRLQADRPGPARLTEFYLWISLGGAAGGLFNVVVAPAIFDSTLEYPLGIVAAALLQAKRMTDRPSRVGLPWQRVLDVGIPVLVVILVIALRQSAVHLRVPRGSAYGVAHVFALPAAIVLACWRRPLRFGLAVAAVLGAALLATGYQDADLHTERTFYGLHRVFQDGSNRRLMHGTTNHGEQSTESRRQCEPLSYYTRTSPIGQIFASAVGRHARRNVAAIGLGTGTLSAYAAPDRHWTFFELNPAVERIARDPSLFTYLSGCGADYRIVLGDARLSLEESSDGVFDLIVVDAFSSDSIPVHLATREALELYLRKMAPGALLAFHISNRYMDLEPVLDSVARDAGLSGRVQNDTNLTAFEEGAGKLASTWVMLAREEDDMGDLVTDERWRPLQEGGRRTLWTDDYSNVVSVLRWRW